MMDLCAPIFPWATRLPANRTPQTSAPARLPSDGVTGKEGKRCAPITSTMSRSPISAVISETSYGGDTSTSSMPHRPSAATIPTIFSASRGSRPPGSGQPVPGTKAASMLSTS